MASELKLAAEKKSKDIIIETEDIDMIVQIYKGEELIASNDSTRESKTYRYDKKGRKKETPLEYRQRKKYEGFTVEITRSEDTSNEESSTVTENIENSNRVITENDFNKNYSLADVPEVDTMYRDMNIDIVGRKGKPVVGKDGENVTVEVQTQESQSSFYGCDIAQEIAEKNKAFHEENVETIEEPEMVNDTEDDCETVSDNNDVNDLAKRMMTGQFDYDDTESSDQDIRAEDIVEIIPRSDISVENDNVTNNEETVDSEYL